VPLSILFDTSPSPFHILAPLPFPNYGTPMDMNFDMTKIMICLHESSTPLSILFSIYHAVALQIIIERYPDISMMEALNLCLKDVNQHEFNSWCIKMEKMGWSLGGPNMRNIIESVGWRANWENMAGKWT